MLVGFATSDSQVICSNCGHGNFVAIKVICLDKLGKTHKIRVCGSCNNSDFYKNYPEQTTKNTEKHFESDIHPCKDHNPELNEIPDEVILKSKLFGKEGFN
ncbi:MAG: hypothetical protein COW26_03915 [Nitrosopumilales archaeon CG15_BIG_FIL_POST_REV_8_21_14_020_33_23]|jgi:hypothetical protein|nr:MAG: hypothetical protein COW26_03915 [Nitrosopumilales archaeon CG15_BIG_FIL_POST_REV_8_21_14_020_33_23]PIY90295.1 MAG: hypothetical protein COY74_02220 [Nitrosopumilales archaeon CG_4_10_14_0_8_um_filter_34_8]PJB96877.1 MAG: hypothetical protein CO079_08905 [Nitrosopumilales archaeon CG_4_9_14_0_8_um_filter_34_10]